MNRILIISVLALSISAKVLDSSFVQVPHEFGAKEYRKETPTGTESIVYLPPKGLFSEPSHMTDFINSAKNKGKKAQDDFLFGAQPPLQPCDGGTTSGDFKFLPMTIGVLTPQNNTVSYSALCFKNNTISLEIQDNETAVVTLTATNPSSFSCSDGYLITTLQNFHPTNVFFHGKHVITLKVSPQEMEMIKTEGLFVFKLCDSTMDFLPSVIKTIWLFLGGIGLNPNIPFFGSRPTAFQTEQNIEFIKAFTGYQWEERPQDVVVDIDESLFQSGDYLAVTRLDGLDQIIELGTGSHSGHSTMILKVNGSTFIVESQDGWYWPDHGIQITPYKQWIQWARNAGFMVTWVPLKPEIAAKFDSVAAYNYFRTIQGTPYGYHNFIFGWIDTPDHSYPGPLSPDFIAAGFAIVEKIAPAAAEKVFTLGLNMRLNTTGLKVAEIALEAAKRGMTMPQLYSVVEQDSWVYPDGISRVCSSFVIDMYKHGGLFGDMVINSAEFTPRDLYEVAFFQTNPTLPENCKSVDPTNPFCQIMGKYRIQLPTVSTVTPYAHMNELCQSEAPLYARIPQGC